MGACVFVCAGMRAKNFFFWEGVFWRMHVYACSHDMHVLYGCAHTRGTTILHTLLQTRAHTEQVLRGKLTFPFLISFLFLWFSSGFVFCSICLSMRFCLFNHFFSMFLLSFCSYTLKFERVTTWWMSWKPRCSLFLPLLRKLLSNVRACEVMLVAHSTRQSIYWSKMYLFYEQLLGVCCSGFFSNKVWELFDARPFP